MIDKNTGQFVVNKDTQIGPNSNISTLQKLNLGEVQALRDMKTGWCWYDVKNLLVGQHYINISFLFEGELLRGYSLVFQADRFPLKPDWSTWSDEKEQRNLERFNLWLDEQLGERFFDWGRVLAHYDQLGGSSSINLRYDRSKNQS